MKKFLFAALLLATTIVNAEVITVLEADLSVLRTRRTNVETRFHMDTMTREGYVKINVSEERYVYSGGPYDWCTGMPGRCYSRPYRQPTYVTIYSTTAKVQNLELIDNKVVYHGRDGDVECGTLGVSRVLRRPTLYLSGKCEFTGKVFSAGTHSKVVVTLKTK